MTIETTSIASQSGGFPTPKPDSTYVGSASSNNKSAAIMQGFVGDGDEIELPTTSGDTLDYNNAAGSNQWALNKSSINASVDDWSGFMYDATDDLIYIVAYDDTADTLYTASVNQAGTVTNIGNAVLSSAPTTTISFTVNVGNAGASNIWRTADGSGNLFLRYSDSNIIKQVEINISTGAIVSGPDDYALMSVAPYETAAGSRVAKFSLSSGDVGTIIAEKDGKQFEVVFNPGFGLPCAGSGGQGLYPMQWGGRIVMGHHSGVRVGGYAYTVSAFNRFGDQFTASLGG